MKFIIPIINSFFFFLTMSYFKSMRRIKLNGEVGKEDEQFTKNNYHYKNALTLLVNKNINTLRSYNFYLITKHSKF